MSNEEEMRRKFVAIGARYLARTATEIGDLQKLVTRLQAGDVATLKEIEILAHRIRGSGAVFGFTKLSDAAGVIEMLAVDSAPTDRLVCEQPREQQCAELSEQFDLHIQNLVIEIQSATLAPPKN